MMTYENFQSVYELKPGNIIRSKIDGLSYVVIANYGNRATAVRTADITNPTEWEVLEWEVLRSEYPKG